MNSAVFMNVLWVYMSVSHGVISTCPFQSPKRTFEESVKKREAQRASFTRTLLEKKRSFYHNGGSMNTLKPAYNGINGALK